MSKTTRKSTVPATPDFDRVWIEIEFHPDADVRERRAARLSDLLYRLGYRGAAGDPKSIVWWNERVSRYCITVDAAGGFLELGNSGHWFTFDNLDRAAEWQDKQARPGPLSEKLGPDENIGST